VRNVQFIPISGDSQVTRLQPKTRDPLNPSKRMRRAIDSPLGRRLYSQRIGMVEPVFGNIRHNKHLTRLSLRGREKVNTQWHLYRMVHNIEKLANSRWRRSREHGRQGKSPKAESRAKWRRETPHDLERPDDDHPDIGGHVGAAPGRQKRGFLAASLGRTTTALLPSGIFQFS